MSVEDLADRRERERGDLDRGTIAAVDGGIVAVVPLFNPDESVVRRLVDIRAQVDMLIAIDDGSVSPLAEPWLARLRDAGIDYRRRTVNLGIAATINEGIRLAQQDGAPGYVVTFDQDSSPAEDCVQQLRATFDEGRSRGLPLGIVAVPEGDLIARNDGFREPYEPIQSGMLMAAALLESIGGFREDFFIDCVDTEFFLRARRRGWDVVVAPAARMNHQLGASRSRALRLFGLPAVHVRSNHHHPIRRYYITRNRLKVYFEYLPRNPRWVLRSMRGEARNLLLNIFVSDVPVKQVCATVFGAVAFLTGRSGRIGAVTARVLR